MRYSKGRKFYRSRNGVIFGVCRGIAEWRDLPVDMVRIAFVVLNVVGFLPFWIYCILALILPAEPSDDQRYDDIKADFDDLKSRVGKMENDEFDRERDWEKRFKDKK